MGDDPRFIDPFEVPKTEVQWPEVPIGSTPEGPTPTREERRRFLRDNWDALRSATFVLIPPPVRYA